MKLLNELLAMPPKLSKASRYTIANGLLYMAAGALLLLWPGAVQTLYLEPSFVGHEEGWVRALGMTLAIIGWFNSFGGRSGGRQIIAASVLDRVVLVPLVLVPLGMMGYFPISCSPLPCSTRFWVSQRGS